MGHTEHPVRTAFREAVSAAPIAPMLAAANTVYVGYSGGADSTALLVLMVEYCRIHGIGCEAIHVHHGIRAGEADRDAEACRAFCLHRGIPLHLCRADVPMYARTHRLGMEEAARAVRYACFEEHLRVCPSAVCATAHSADDQLETVLFHMLRGSGLEGMCGIPPARGAYIRPLLCASAADIRDFCRAEHLSYVQDSTNADTSCTRNYIRAEIVPRLRQITPSPEAAAVRMSALLRTDAAYLREESRRALAGTSADSMQAERLAALPDALLSRAIAQLYTDRVGGAQSLNYVHIRDVMRLVRRGEPGQIHLPGGWTARLFDGVLSLSPGEACTPAPPPEYRASLHFGENYFPEYGFALVIGKKNETEITDGKNIYKLSIWYSFPYDTIQNELYVRFRRPGDKVRLGSMTRSVKKLLNEKRIPPEKRSLLPIVCDGRGILVIPGVCVRDAESDDAREQIGFFAAQPTYADGSRGKSYRE